MIITEQLDFPSLLFGNPVTFLTGLAQVIRQTKLAKDNNESIDVSCKGSGFQALLGTLIGGEPVTVNTRSVSMW